MRHLETKLPSSQIASPDVLLADISHHINTAKSLMQKPPPRFPQKLGRSLEKSGRDLWNLCIRLKRDASRHKKLDCRVRLFALHVLELGRLSRDSAKRDEETEIVYFLELTMTLGRICLQDEDIESGSAALQKAAELVDRLKALHQAVGLDNRVHQAHALEADYLTMRMALVSPYALES